MVKKCFLVLNWREEKLYNIFYELAEIKEIYEKSICFGSLLPFNIYEYSSCLPGKKSMERQRGL